MERGPKFYIALAAGVVSVVFLISGLCVPLQMVFELKPFARVVLQSGNLANWTAESLHLDQDTFQKVRDNYQEYLTSNRRGGDDSSDSDDGEESSESSSDEADIARELPGPVFTKKPKMRIRLRIKLINCNYLIKTIVNLMKFLPYFQEG